MDGDVPRRQSGRLDLTEEDIQGLCKANWPRCSSEYLLNLEYIVSFLLL
jgi:hypothetical protein